MSYVSQQCAPFLSPKLYALGVLPIRPAWVLPLWQADYVGGLLGLVGPWSGWLLGPALCGGCQLLVGGAWSQGS